MKQFMKWLQPLLHSGIQETDSDALKRKIRILNSILLVAISASLIIFIASLFVERKISPMIQLTRTGLLLLAYVVTRIRWLNISFIMISAVVLFPTILNLYQEDYQTTYFYSVIPYIVFSQFYYLDRPRQSMLYSLLAAAIFILIHHYYQEFLPPNPTDVIYIISFLTIMLVFVGTLRIYIVENQRVQEELLDVSERINTSIASRQRLFSIISADLKSPLMSIKRLSTMMEPMRKQESEMGVTESQSDFFLHVESAYAMLEDLVKWSKSQMDGFQMEAGPIRISDLLTDILGQVELLLKHKQINILFDVDTDDTVYADRSSIEFILRQLINNAIKYSYRNGTVSVEGRYVDKHYMITIEDHGVGMLESEAAEIFQVDGPRRPGTENETGSGLGLHLCKEFIERNNGEISVESRLGEGSRFVVTLPRPEALLLPGSEL